MRGSGFFCVILTVIFQGILCNEYGWVGPSAHVYTGNNWKKDNEQFNIHSGFRVRRANNIIKQTYQFFHDQSSSIVDPDELAMPMAKQITSDFYEQVVSYDNSIIKNVDAEELKESAEQSCILQEVITLEEQLRQYAHRPEWKLHQNILLLRSNALSSLKSNQKLTTEEYSLSQKVNGYLDDHFIDKEFFKICYGNALQQEVHSEFVDISIIAAGYWYKLSCKKQSNLISAIAYLTEAGMIFNHVEKVHNALMLADACWFLLDCIQGIGEGIVDASRNTFYTILHPTDAIKNMLCSAKICGYYIGKLAIEICDLSYLSFMEPKKCYEKMYIWHQDISCVCQALIEKCKALPARDIVKTVTAIGLEYYATSKVHSGIYQLFDNAKKYTQFLSKKKDYFIHKENVTTTQGVVINASKKATSYIKNHQKNVRSSSVVINSAKKLTTKDINKIAKKLNFKKTNYYSHGQPVFRKGNLYITPDVDSHNGGIWKMATSIENLRSKKTRIGTYDVSLKRIGD